MEPFWLQEGAWSHDPARAGGGAGEADAQSVTVRGKGYHFVVAGFFGGWQATLYIPEQEPVTFYGEAVEALELRLKGKLSGRPVD